MPASSRDSSGSWRKYPAMGVASALVAIACYLILAPRAGMSPGVARGDGDRDPPSVPVSREAGQVDREEISRRRADEPEDPTRKLLRAIRIPRVRFDDTSVAEAVDYVRIMTTDRRSELREDYRKVREAAGHPETGYAGMEVNGPLATVSERERAFRIRLEADDISGWELLHLIARQAGMKVGIVDGQVVFFSGEAGKKEAEEPLR